MNTRTNKTLVLIFSFSAVLGFGLTNKALADDCPSGKLSCGENCCYVIDDGEIKFSRIDENTTGTIGGVVFADNNTITKAVEIPTWITSVGHLAFGNIQAPSIHVPSSVTHISELAFADTREVKIDGDFTMDYVGVSDVASPPIFPGIRSLVIGDNATFTINDINRMLMGGSGGESCAGSTCLTSISLGNGITGDVADILNIVDKNPTDLSIGNGITGIIPERAFTSATNLTSVSLGNGITGIGYAAFADSGLTSITIPDSITNIEDAAFAGTGLTSITIPDSVTSIGGSVFADCENLTSVELGNGVETIWPSTFRNTGLTSITIPDSVTIIGGAAFADCENLTSVELGNGVEDIWPEAFKNTGLTSIEFPDSLKTIAPEAFAGTGLTSITIPDSVNYIGDSAFYDCNDLTSITIPDSVEIIEGNAFGKCALTSITASDEMIEKIMHTSGTDLGGLQTLNCTDKRDDGMCEKICGEFKNITCNISSSCETGYFRIKGECRAKPEGCTTMAFGVCSGCADGYEQFKDTCVPIIPPFSASDCYANGQVPYKNECVDEYPYAKKHYTPAEAAQWLRDDDDNTIVLTFKK